MRASRSLVVPVAALFALLLVGGLLAGVGRSLGTFADWFWSADEPDRPHDRCGEPIDKPDGSPWECTLAEDFDGDALDEGTWTAMQQVGSHDLCLIDSPSTVAVADGRLRLSVVEADQTTPCPLRADGTRARYASGQVSTHARWSQQYGRFEARVKVQEFAGPGLHEAFWLWPDTRYGADRPWPQTGEIDVMETYSNRPDRVIPFLHYSADSGGPVDGLNTAWGCESTRGEWHDYALEWTADRLEVLVDGKACLVNTDGAATFRKPFIVALTQFMGTGANQYDGRVPLPATMEVDWVRAWE